MPRPTKRQINIKMPEPLIEALKTRAIDEGDTFTDLVIRFCSEGLESESDPGTGKSALRHRPVAVTKIAPTQLDERIADQLAPLQKRLVAIETELGELSA